MKIKKIILSLSLVISFLFISGFTTLAQESETTDGETYFNDYLNYSWDFYKFKLTGDDVWREATYTNFYYFRIDVKLPDNALIDGTNTPFAIYSFNGYKLKYGNIIQTAQRYNIHGVKSGNVIVVNITINKRSVDDYIEANLEDPQDQIEYWNTIANYINEYFVAYYAKTDTYDVGYDDGYDAGFNDGYNSGYQNGREDGERLGYQNGYEDGRYDGYWDGRSDGYNRGFNDGYNEGYEDGYNDFNVADYFGDRNIAKDRDTHYSAQSDPLDPSISKVIFNKGYNYPNTLLDKPYLIVIIKKNIYDYVTVLFDDYARFYHHEARHYDIGDYDIYVFNFSVRLNEKYRIEIIKENITTGEEAMKFFDDVVDNLYFSHASKLLTSEIASEFYYFGYITGLEENITDNDAYNVGFENGYDRGYNEGHEDGYDQGYEDGYEDGFDDGKTAEYDKGYKDGYKQGSNDTFLNDVSKWFGPMVLIVLIAGAYVSLRNRRSDG